MKAVQVSSATRRPRPRKIRLSKDLDAQLQKEAERRDVSFSRLCYTILRDAMLRMRA